ncbi:MAG: acyltransferase [Lachnospiraceae bacterium]|nr:acyltransferase [Lachnospiraceae bacterium]
MSDFNNQTTKKNNRQTGFELLRIISMLMIIAMHYMTKGMKIEKLSIDCSMTNVIYWIIYALCVSSVNAYVFISGYFATDSKWNLKKLIRLWAQVLSYSILVPLILSAFGAFDLKGAPLSVKQQIFLPVTYEHYWFATAYIMLYLISYVLNVAISKLDKKSYKTVLLALLVVFCGFKSIDPYLIPWDKYGNDMIWFIILYLIGGYIRTYGLPFTDNKTKKETARFGLVTYAAFSLITFLIAYAFSFIVRSTGKLEYYMDMTYCYNYVTVLIASIGLFAAFANMDIGHRPWINKIAKYTFGVYLLHDNIVLREKWQHLLLIDAAQEKWWQILHMLICIIIVFIVGCVIDLVRDGVFNAFAKTGRNRQ